MVEKLLHKWIRGITEDEICVIFFFEKLENVPYTHFKNPETSHSKSLCSDVHAVRCLNGLLSASPPSKLKWASQTSQRSNANKSSIGFRAAFTAICHSLMFIQPQRVAREAVWNADVSLFNVHLFFATFLLEPAEPLAVNAIKHRETPTLCSFTLITCIFS